MTKVPDGVLQWLYNSLKPQYLSVERAYSDAAQTLSAISSLRPKTDVYTFDNGSSALLLQLQGTLPVQFRGTEYRFPISLWVPHSYPREPPILFVTPTEDMVVRPGQHVSSEGRVYHPYLAHWENHWDKSNIVDALQIIADVFAKEPPVMSRRRQSAQGEQMASLPSYRRPQAQQAAPPPPPPPPPKPSDARRDSSLESGDAPEQRGTLTGNLVPPALPPKPSHPDDDLSRTAQTGFHAGKRSDPLYSPPSQLSARQGPPPPPLPSNFGGRKSETLYVDDRMRQSHRPPSLYDSWQPQPQSQPALNSSAQQPMEHPQNLFAPSLAQTARSFQVQPQAQPHPKFLMRQQPLRKRPVEDLMSSPLDVTVASQLTGRTNVPAPPIPPNPEKDALLHAISQALTSRLREIESQNLSAIPSLEAQNAAMQQAYQSMSSELRQLQSLDSMLSSNEKILHDTMRDADRVMENVKRKEVPKIDDVLVAPTVVGEQLYGLVAEERAIGDAMFALTRAMDHGTTGADVYIKQTRSLAREQFFKKALIKKVARGMGLSMDAI